MSHVVELETIMVVFILLLYNLFAHCIDVKEVKCIHESSVAVILGALVALLVKMLGDDIEFSESSFFLFILPPIILAAGFTLKSKNFLKNFGYITLYGIAGTIISMVVLGLQLYGWGRLIPIKTAKEDGEYNLKFGECLLLATVLCATDTVAAVAVIKERDFPKLNSIVFGESVINDAVSILLFRAVSDLVNSKEGAQGLQGTDILMMLLKFMYLSLISVLIGLFVGLLASLILKHLPSMKRYPVRQIFFMILMAYFGYMVSEVSSFSGIMTLFCTGFTMSHYGYYNISKESQSSTVHAINTMSFAAQAFVFIYLGMSVLSLNDEDVEFSFWFALATLFSAIIARGVSILLPTFFVWLFRCCKPLNVSWKYLLMIWYSGMIKGAVAFALSLQINPAFRSKQFIVSTTLVIVLITTILLGAFMSAFARFVGIKVERGESHHQHLRDRSALHNRWRRFDDNCLKRIFGGKITLGEEYDATRDEHLELHEQALISTAIDSDETAEVSSNQYGSPNSKFKSLFGDEPKRSVRNGYLNGRLSP